MALAIALSSFFIIASAGAAFNASYIVSDGFMSASGTMSEAQIEQFLQQQESYLASYYVPTHSKIGPNDNVDSYSWPASHVIWQVANWYGINPEVILATLQKEQSLVSDPNPPQWALDWAMGYGCPDSTGCASYPGFATQVDMGTWNLWFNMYYANRHDSRVAPYLTGKTVNIDGTAVYLGNGATAALYRYTPHFHGNQNFYSICVRWFGLDHWGPELSNPQPASGGTTSNSRPLIFTDVSGSAIVPGNISITLDGKDVTAGSTRTTTYASYRPPAPLGPGAHTVGVALTDSWGASTSETWSFNVASPSYNPHDYYWTWYDGISSKNWVLMANPALANQGALFFDLYIGGRYMGLSPFGGVGQSPGFAGSLVVGPGSTATPHFSGVMGGPVDAASASGAAAVTSQRVLWGQNSFEELPGIDSLGLSSDYYWTWYDQQSPGFKNWVLVSDPNSYPVYYEVYLAGQLANNGWIGPGASATPTFPGKMGGPVEVKAWSDQSKTSAAKVIASQRVLSSGGSAFNEVAGIPASALSDHYLWTWYDMLSAGARDWVLVANPGVDHAGNTQGTVTVVIKVAGVQAWSGTLAPGASATPTFAGVMGGPVEVDSTGDVIATQRSIWGPSFEEVPGYAVSGLKSDYLWTWYDQKSPGSTNWVLVANPGTSAVNYRILIGGKQVAAGALAPGGRAIPTFPGRMGGPVEVQASGNVAVSQRVLWNGYFNEVRGT